MKEYLSIRTRTYQARSGLYRIVPVLHVLLFSGNCEVRVYDVCVCDGAACPHAVLRAPNRHNSRTKWYDGWLQTTLTIHWCNFWWLHSIVVLYDIVCMSYPYWFLLLTNIAASIAWLGCFWYAAFKLYSCLMYRSLRDSSLVCSSSGHSLLKKLACSAYSKGHLPQ